MRPRAEYVYLVSFGADHKIGISWNAERRVKTYGSSARVIGIWHRPEHAADIELEIKWRMERLRSRGLECFKVPLDIMVEFTESVIGWFDVTDDKAFERMQTARQRLTPYMKPLKKKRKKVKILLKREAS